jgi:hypothetical protein
MTFPAVVGVSVLVFGELAGLVMLGKGIQGLLCDNQVKKWPTAEAVVATCDVEYLPDSEGGQTFRVDVDYQYTVEGQEYRGNRVALGYGPSTDLEFHKQLAQRLKTAKTVLVRYNPRNASDAVLAFGANYGSWALTIYGVIFCISSLGLGCLWIITSQGDPDILKTLIMKE